jgi:CDP-diacylglycerol--glycerol-3-phosphate 3-phosphatidyltransferase
MPSVYDLKPKFQALLRPLVRSLAGIGVRANHVTVFAMLLSLGAGGVIFFCAARDLRWLWLLPGVLFVRMALNAIDGMLAREHGQQSRLGAILNELGDVVSDLGLYLPLAVLPQFDATALLACVLIGLLTEFTGVLGPGLGATRRYDGPFGKSDRALLFGVLGLLVGAGYGGAEWIYWVLVVASLLGLLTVVNRMRGILGESK